MSGGREFGGRISAPGLLFLAWTWGSRKGMGAKLVRRYRINSSSRLEARADPKRKVPPVIWSIKDVSSTVTMKTEFKVREIPIRYF